jgi:hypothetical protein
LLFLSFPSLGQFAIKIKAEITRIGMISKNLDSSHSERVLLVFEGNNIGLVTSSDTLELHYSNLTSNFYVYTDRWNGRSRKYSVLYIRVKDRISLFITPLRPYKEGDCAINVKL